MAARNGYDRSERQNEYFLPGEGISREVIQADICRYLGNDALVRPGNHNGRQGFFIRGYRNLTSEMIADLKADSARWEADVTRRVDMGYPRGSYAHQQEKHSTPAPASTSNGHPTNYATPAIHEARQQQGPSPPTYNAVPAPQFADSYSSTPYNAAQNTSYQQPQPYTSGHSPYAPNQAAYPPPQQPYTGAVQPPVSAPDMHQSYTYATSNGHAYENGRNTAPRYPGPGYEKDSDYSPVTSGIGFPATTAADTRIGMDTRFTPESFAERRPQPVRERETHRRVR